jgi:hypothetical protein
VLVFLFVLVERYRWRVVLTGIKQIFVIKRIIYLSLKRKVFLSVALRLCAFA